MPVFNRNRPFFNKHTALMPIFCQKTAFIFIPKTLCSHVIFFQVLHEKPSAFMPIFGQKNVTSNKITLFYEPKKSIGWSFVPFFTKINALMPIFYQKYIYSLKNTMLWSPYFVKKTSILWKTLCSYLIFVSNFLCKKPLL